MRDQSIVVVSGRLNARHLATELRAPGSRRIPRPATADRGYRHRLRRALGAAAAVVALTSCGVRLDTPPPEVPVADATEQSRQGAARAAAELYAAAQAARATATGDPGLTQVLIAVESAAAEHHAALGGVWEPWPGAGPEATAYPGSGDIPTTPAPQAGSATPQAVLDLLEESAAVVHQGALSHGGDLGQLLASVAISRSYLAADLGGALSVQAQSLPAEPLPPPEPGSIDPDTSRAVDAARYTLEVVAARSSGDQRASAVERGDQLGAVAGAVAPEEDQRNVAYDVTDVTAPEGTTPERVLAGAAELDVVRAYVALLATEVQERDAVLAAATYAAGQARSWGAALPALPGLA